MAFFETNRDNDCQEPLRKPPWPRCVEQGRGTRKTGLAKNFDEE
jgi:hypothetical protein